LPDDRPALLNRFVFLSGCRVCRMTRRERPNARQYRIRNRPKFYHGATPRQRRRARPSRENETAARARGGYAT